jgi:hypothetical protein
MTKLEKLLMAELAKLPFEMIEALVAKKLHEGGLASHDANEIAPKLLQHVRAGNEEAFIWEELQQHLGDSLKVEVTADETAEILNRFETFLERELPKILVDAAVKTAESTLGSLKQRWPEQFASERATIEAFRSNLEARWAEGFHLLRMLITICLELGDDNLRRYRRSKKRRGSNLQGVLIRLHARACQVCAEMMSLMEAGFADGAMARWRTLHEINTVAAVLVEHGEEIADRYVAHEVVEAKRAMDLYAKSHVLLGYKPIAKRDQARIVKRYEKALATYGVKFRTDYGWAAKHLKKECPTFADLEEEAGRNAFRSHYRMASYNVHAGAKGIFFKLGVLDQSHVIAGASNTGFLEPAQNMAISLTSITSILLAQHRTLDSIVAIQVLVDIRDQVPAAFDRAERKLRRDDALSRQDQQSQKRS